MKTLRGVFHWRGWAGRQGGSRLPPVEWARDSAPRDFRESTGSHSLWSPPDGTMSPGNPPPVTTLKMFLRAKVAMQKTQVKQTRVDSSLVANGQQCVLQPTLLPSPRYRRLSAGLELHPIHPRNSRPAIEPSIIPLILQMETQKQTHRLAPNH